MNENVSTPPVRESEMPRVAVVIPFYQRDAGILARALRSIAGQSPLAASLDVIVVDDASPISPSDDIGAVDLPPNVSLHLIRQANGGPASARNRGLAFAESLAVHYVAFLDSDDEWMPEHLGTALACLQAGASFYFCDNIRHGPEGQDPEIGFDQTWDRRSSTREIVPTTVGRETFLMSGPVAFSALMESYLSQTSTVVFAVNHHAGARFDETLRGAGEDHLLWLDMARRSSNVAFSTRANVVCGLGVNIYFSATDWRNPATVSRYGYLSLLYSRILKSFDLTEKQVVSARSRRDAALSLYAYLLIRNLPKGQAPQANLLGEILGATPFGILRLTYLAIAFAARSATDRKTFADAVR